jgi:hypothetical protein
MVRPWLFGVLAACLAAAAPEAARSEPATPGQAASRAPTKKPAPLDIAKQHVQRPPPRGHAVTQAPVPNRSVERPRVVVEERASLGPSVLRRSLPGQGLASNGSPDELEETLFLPGPGARLRLPFSY